MNIVDVTVKLNNNQFVRDLYCKPTDSHQYLHSNSFHPEHMKKSSIYNQGRQIKGYAPSWQNVKECYEFRSHVTKETFKINHCFDCNSKSLIYLISCKVWSEQYV